MTETAALGGTGGRGRERAAEGVFAERSQEFRTVQKVAAMASVFPACSVAAS